MQKEHSCPKTGVINAEAVAMLKRLCLEQTEPFSPEFQDWQFCLGAFDLYTPSSSHFPPQPPGQGLIAPSIVYTDKDQNFMDLSSCQSLSEQA